MKKRLLVTMMIMILAFSTDACGASPKSLAHKSQATAETIQSMWPTDGAAGMIPVPNKESGSIGTNSSDYYWATVTNYSQELFYEYVNSVKAAGFTVDFLQYNTWYSATDQDGNNITLSYDENNQTMDITFYVNTENTL